MQRSSSSAGAAVALLALCAAARAQNTMIVTVVRTFNSSNANFFAVPVTANEHRPTQGPSQHDVCQQTEAALSYKDVPANRTETYTTNQTLVTLTRRVNTTTHHNTTRHTRAVNRTDAATNVTTLVNVTDVVNSTYDVNTTWWVNVTTNVTAERTVAYLKNTSYYKTFVQCPLIKEERVYTLPICMRDRNPAAAHPATFTLLDTTSSATSTVITTYSFADAACTGTPARTAVQHVPRAGVYKDEALNMTDNTWIEVRNTTRNMTFYVDETAEKNVSTQVPYGSVMIPSVKEVAQVTAVVKLANLTNATDNSTYQGNVTTDVTTMVNVTEMVNTTLYREVWGMANVTEPVLRWAFWDNQTFNVTKWDFEANWTEYYVPTVATVPDKHYLLKTSFDNSADPGQNNYSCNQKLPVTTYWNTSAVHSKLVPTNETVLKPDPDSPYYRSVPTVKAVAQVNATTNATTMVNVTEMVNTTFYNDRNVTVMANFSWTVVTAHNSTYTPPVWAITGYEYLPSGVCIPSYSNGVWRSVIYTCLSAGGYSQASFVGTATCQHDDTTRNITSRVTPVTKLGVTTNVTTVTTTYNNVEVYNSSTCRMCHPVVVRNQTVATHYKMVPTNETKTEAVVNSTFDAVTKANITTTTYKNVAVLRNVSYTVTTDHVFYLKNCTFAESEHFTLQCKAYPAGVPRLSTPGARSRKRPFVGGVWQQRWAAYSHGGALASIDPPVCRRTANASRFSRVVGDEAFGPAAANSSGLKVQAFAFDGDNCQGDAANETWLANRTASTTAVGSAVPGGLAVAASSSANYCPASYGGTVYAVLRTENSDRTCKRAGIIGEERGLSSGPSWPCLAHYHAAEKTWVSAKYECISYGKTVVKTVYNNTECDAASLLEQAYHPNRQCQALTDGDGAPTGRYEAYECIYFDDAPCTTTSTTRHHHHHGHGDPDPPHAAGVDGHGAGEVRAAERLGHPGQPRGGRRSHGVERPL